MAPLRNCNRKQGTWSPGEYRADALKTFLFSDWILSVFRKEQLLLAHTKTSSLLQPSLLTNIVSDSMPRMYCLQCSQSWSLFWDYMYIIVSVFLSVPMFSISAGSSWHVWVNFFVQTEKYNCSEPSSPRWVTQLVGVSSCTPRAGGFDPWLRAQGRQLINVSFPRRCLSPFLS